MNEDMTNGSDTGGDDARTLLESLYNEQFNGSFEEAALVLGRTPAEIEGILNGDEVLDDDLEMKVRGIARERGVGVE